MSDPENTGIIGYRNPPVHTRFQSGNPGKPKGARTKLGEAFIEALAADFDQHGAQAIIDARAESPVQYVRVIASLLPKDVNLNVNSTDDLSDADLAERIRELATQLSPLLTGGTGNADATDEGASGPAIASSVH